MTTKSSPNSSLPSSPSSEQLKKQAKDALKAFRDGDPDICSLLRRLKKFADCTSDQILAGDLCLREVQQALARNYGFNCWRDLMTHCAASKPVVKSARELAEDVAKTAYQSRTSDIVLAQTGDELTVRFRIDGVLRDAETRIGKGDLIGGFKELAGIDVSANTGPQQGIARVNWDPIQFSLKVTLASTEGGESIVARILDPGISALRFPELGFLAPQAATLNRWIASSEGIIAFTGPGDSGKSTTLYTAFDQVGASRRRLVVGDDPTYFLTRKTGRSAEDASREVPHSSVLSGRPDHGADVILMDQDLDDTMIDNVCEAATDGCLLMVRLRAENSIDALWQMKEMAADPNTLGRSIRGIVSQRLVRRVCADCRFEYRPSDELQKTLGIDADTPLFKGNGCDGCEGTGYRGRISVHELLEMTDDLRAALVESRTSDELAARVYASGTVTLRQDIRSKVLSGMTSVEEAFSL